MSYEITIKETRIETVPDANPDIMPEKKSVERVIYSQLVEENPLKAVITAVNARRRKRTATAKTP